MARAALGWTVRDLAREARLGVATVNRFEVGKPAANRTTLEHLRDAFERAGVRFLPDGCVCPPPGEPESGT